MDGHSYNAEKAQYFQSSDIFDIIGYYIRTYCVDDVSDIHMLGVKRSSAAATGRRPDLTPASFVTLT